MILQSTRGKIVTLLNGSYGNADAYIIWIIFSHVFYVMEFCVMEHPLLGLKLGCPLSASPDLKEIT